MNSSEPLVLTLRIVGNSLEVCSPADDDSHTHTLTFRFTASCTFSTVKRAGSCGFGKANDRVRAQLPLKEVWWGVLSAGELGFSVSARV